MVDPNLVVHHFQQHAHGNTYILRVLALVQFLSPQQLPATSCFLAAPRVCGHVHATQGPKRPGYALILHLACSRGDIFIAGCIMYAAGQHLGYLHVSTLHERPALAKQMQGIKQHHGYYLANC
jgi:hypothetical protein